jgi:hypothetical protein
MKSYVRVYNLMNVVLPGYLQSFYPFCFFKDTYSPNQ